MLQDWNRESDMKFAKCLVALMLMLMAAHLQAAVAVQVAKTVDFTQFKTFAWRQGTPAPDPGTETMIRNAIQKELLAKGLTRVDGDADLLVLTHARQASELREDVDILGVQQRWPDDSEPDGVSGDTLREVEVGTLVVDLLDGNSRLEHLARHCHQNPKRKPESCAQADRQGRQEDVRELPCQGRLVRITLASWHPEFIGPTEHSDQAGQGHRHEELPDHGLHPGSGLCYRRHGQHVAVPEGRQRHEAEVDEEELGAEVDVFLERLEVHGVRRESGLIERRDDAIADRPGQAQQQVDVDCGRQLVNATLPGAKTVR